MKKSATEILEMRKKDLTPKPNENPIEFANRAKRFERILEKFYTWLQNEKGTNLNSSGAYTRHVKQLFRFYEMSIKTRRGSPIRRNIKSVKNFKLTIEHIRKIYKIANLNHKVIISMLTDLGLRISDLLSIKRDNLPDLEQNPPIEFQIMTNKEKVVATGFLSQETIDVLKTYLLTIKEDKKEFLFPSNGSHLTVGGVNKYLKRLAMKAEIQIPSNKSISTHVFRKLFLSTAVNCQVPVQGDKLVGKEIDRSKDTYYNQINLKTAWLRIKKHLTINVESGSVGLQNKLDMKDESISRQQKQISDLTERLDSLTNTVKNVEALQEELFIYIKGGTDSTDIPERAKVRHTYCTKCNRTFLLEKNDPTTCSECGTPLKPLPQIDEKYREWQKQNPYEKYICINCKHEYIIKKDIQNKKCSKCGNSKLKPAR